MTTWIAPAGGRKIVSGLVALILALSSILGSDIQTVQATLNTWTDTGSMSQNRAYHGVASTNTADDPPEPTLMTSDPQSLAPRAPNQTEDATWYAYVRNSEPWNSGSNITAMDAVFGSGQWQGYNYSVNISTLLTGRRFIFLEGSNYNANALNTFLNTNRTAIENWVSGGGCLFLNAAPNEGGSINFGFGGTTLVYQDVGGQGIALNSAHPIFAGPFTPIATSYTGSYFSHAHLAANGGAPVIRDETGDWTLYEKSWGAGLAMFGGMTMANYHSPQPQGQNLRQNIFYYVNDHCQNDAPVAQDDVYDLDEDTSLVIAAPGVLANDADANGDPLTAALVEDVAVGVLDLYSSGAFTYTPELDWNGVVTFTYHANDGELDSNTATVTLTVELPPVLYVDQAATGAATGLSWTDAYTNVQDALAYTNAHSGSDFEIWVAKGVYYPDEGAGRVNNAMTETFRIARNNVQLYGGFAATETLRTERDWIANPTTLSGDIDGDDINTDGNYIAETWNDLQGANAYHVLWLDGVTYENITETVMLDGFTITAGNASSTGWDDKAYGGGLYCWGDGSGGECSPTLNNVIFSGNMAYRAGGGMYNRGRFGKSNPTLTGVTFYGNYVVDGSGGGMYNYGPSNPVLTYVTFDSNSAAGWQSGGGGIYNYGNSNGVSSPVLTHVTFSGNSSRAGGGMYNKGHFGVSDPILTHVTFSGNSASQDGGGMYNDSYNQGQSSPELTDVIFESNSASNSGGGMYNFGWIGQSNPRLTNVIFRGNSANYGGGMYSYSDGGGSSPTLINVIFSGNSAGSGGGMYNSAYDSECNPILVNVTFSGNRASSGSGGGMYSSDDQSQPTLVNSVLWGNTAFQNGPQIHNAFGATTVISYSLIQGDCPPGATCGAGMLYTDPHFIAPSAASSAPTVTGNYRLQVTSPAIDVGNNLSVTVGADLDGNPRIVNDVVDLGAYEVQPHPILSFAQAVTPTTTVPYHGVVTYTLVLTNAGAGQDSHLIFTDTLPAQVAFGDWIESPASGSLIHEGNAITWTGVLTEHTALTLAFTATHTGDYGDVVTNTAYFSGTYQQGYAEATFRVVEPNVSIAKSVTPTANVPYHGIVTYTLILSNTGVASDSNVTLTDTLPGEVAFGGWLENSGASHIAGEITWNGVVTAGESVTFIFTATHTGSYGEVVTNTAYFNGARQQGSADAAFQVTEPAVLYVNKSAPGSIHDGLSWTTAYTTVQNALDYTNARGYATFEIWVAGGVYYPDEGGAHVNNARTESFRIAWNNVQLYGGFAATETLRSERDWVTHPTILSGDIDGDDVNTDGNFIAETWNDIQGQNTYHVLYLDGVTNQPIVGATVIDGFIITAGYANGAAFQDYIGGGLYCRAGNGECSPTLTNVTFSGNQASYGGGMYNDAQTGVSNPTLTNVIFSNNQGSWGGGGMYNRGRDNGQSSPMLTDVVFHGNAAVSGGGMYNDGYAGMSNPTLFNVIFRAQSASTGGGMYNNGEGENGASNPVLTNVVFSGNLAGSEGGGMYNTGAHWGQSNPVLTNVTFSGNRAVSGGGMYNYAYWYGESTPTLVNSILWGNTATNGPQMHNGTNSAATLSYTLLEGSCPTGATCGAGMLLNTNPRFIAPLNASQAPTAGGDYHLSPGSPAIDVGNTLSVTVGMDLDGNPRIVNGVVDLGAYEAPLYPNLSISKAVTPTVDVAYHGVVTYTIGLSNTGGVSDPAVLLTDALPADVDFGDWIEQPLDGDLIHLGNTITWTGVLTEQIALTFVFTATHTGDYGDVVTNTAYFSGTSQQGSAEAGFTVESNDAPLAVDDSYTLNENTALIVAAPGVLDNDTDADGDPLTATLADASRLNGALTFNPDGSFVYTPTLHVSGVFTFSYYAHDGELASNIATVTLTVSNLPPSAPVLLAPTHRTITDTAELTLTWDVVAGATGYRLDLGGAVQDVGEVTTLAVGPLAARAYTWTVAAYDVYGAVSDFAAPWVFAITSAPQSVTLAPLIAETVLPFGGGICGSVRFTETGVLPDSITITYTYNFPSVNYDGLLGQYQITAEGGENYEAVLTLCYTDADLLVVDIDPAQEADLHIYRYVHWEQPWRQYSEVDPVANTVTAHNVTEFGVFGLGVEANQPTAVAMRGFAAMGSQGLSLLAGMLLAGAAVVVTQRRKARRTYHSQASRPALSEPPMYEIPVIVYEGALEIQAGSPLGVVDFAELEDLDW